MDLGETSEVMSQGLSVCELDTHRVEAFVEVGGKEEYGIQ
jgi:hypothetical protein